MMGRIPEWGLAFMLALAAHVALAVGFGNSDEALIERGPGDGGPIVMGSLVDSITGDLEAQEASDAEDVVEAEAVSRPEEVKPAEDVPLVDETPEVVEAQPVDAVREADIPPITDTPPVLEKLADNTIQPEELNEPEPEEATEPVADAVMPPLPQDVAQIVPQTPPVREIPIPEIKPLPVKKKQIKKKPVTKPVRRKKKIKKLTRRGGRVDSRRGGSGGKGRTGGGGKGLGGRAMMSNYKGRVVAHLRRYKSYPAKARRRGIKGLVRVRFTINSAGRVISSRIVSGSGSPILDSGARATIRRANPFPSFPKGIGKSRMTFVVPIRFNSR